MSPERYAQWLTLQERQCLAEQATWQARLNALMDPPRFGDTTWASLGQWQDWAAGLPARRAEAEAALSTIAERLHQLRQQQRQWERWQDRQRDRTMRKKAQHAQRIIDEQWGHPKSPVFTEGDEFPVWK